MSNVNLQDRARGAIMGALSEMLWRLARTGITILMNFIVITDHGSTTIRIPNPAGIIRA